MNLGFQPRKTSRPLDPHAHNSRFFQRVRLKTVVWMFAGVLFLIVLLSQFRSGRSQPQHGQQIVPAGTPPVVIVTTIDPAASEEWKNMINVNRKEYAALHGYATFLPSVHDYKPINETNVPTSWAKIPAVRHAMTKYPHSTFFFYLGNTAIFANPHLSIEKHITNNARLEALIIPDQPIIPPDSVIRTVHWRSADQADFITTQDSEGLTEDSFILRNGDWARYFLDSWYDPLYRSYNFQRAEGHALEHLVQWHSTILGRLALVPQKIMNAYVGVHSADQFAEGDFVANYHRCSTAGNIPCEAGLRPYYERFKQALPHVPA